MGLQGFVKHWQEGIGWQGIALHWIEAHRQQRKGRKSSATQGQECTALDCNVL